jgi:hypothetical protein
MTNVTRSALAIGLFVAAAAAGCWMPTLVTWDADPDDSGVSAIAADAPALLVNEFEVPIGVHATWQRRPDTTLTFSWRTKRQSGYVPRVWLAPADGCTMSGGEVILPAGAEHTVSGAGVPYVTETGPRVEWIVEAIGLEPNTDYYYRVGTWDSFDAASGALVGEHLGPVRRARTGLPPGSDEPFTFAVAGDTQGALVDLADHVEEIAETPAAFWLFTGDLTSSSAQLYWDKWFAAAAPLLDRAVVMPVRGNHELSYETFYGQFALPIEPDLPFEIVEHAWSFDYGNVHVVGLDATKDADMETIAEWLDADLAAAAADPAIDWKIVFFHYPAYSASSHGCTARVLAHWVPVFDAHGVDIAFSGHDHDYERTVQITDGVAAFQGMTYIVAGAFFAPLYNAGDEWWTEYSEKTDNYIVVDVDGPTLRVTALDPNDQSVVDEVFLTKEHVVLPRQ